jgi:hypothetical protein
MKTVSKLLVLSWLFSGLAVVHAEVLVGNLGQAAVADAFITMSYSAKYAQKFTTGNLNLGDADLNGLVYHKFSWALEPARTGYDPALDDYPLAETTYFEWSLLSDVGGSPGTDLIGATIFTISSPGVASDSYNGSYGSFALQSNSSYWLSIRFRSASSSTGISSFPNLPVASGSSVYGAGSLGGLMVNTGTGWTGLSERALIEIEAESVPEPASLQLLGFSLGSLWILRGRRRKV